MKLKKHTKAWFVARIGKDLIKNETNLFNPAVKTASKSHAIALFLTQIEKGYKYQEII